MKVVAFNGSPRENGNTALLLKEVLATIAKAGISTELIQVGAENINGCTACYQCMSLRNKKCVITKDIGNSCLEKAYEADGIIIGSPTYFTDVSAETKALIDRMGFVSIANGGLLKRKAGAAVVAVRRAGGVHAFDSINHMYQMSGMFIVGSIYWNLGFGRDAGDAGNDEEGMRNMRDLGENMAWLLNRIKE